MNETATKAEPRLYFRSLAVLLVEHALQEQSIVSQILGGFKVRAIHKCRSAEEAMSQIQHEPADLVIVGANLGAMDGYDFIKWLRFADSVASRTAPVILMAGHTRLTDIQKARDCGASFVIAKPVTSRVLFERIAWLARDDRAFTDTAAYKGPDRRFRKLGPPPGVQARRYDDLSHDADASSVNLSQAEIDALLKTKEAAQ